MYCVLPGVVLVIELAYTRGGGEGEKERDWRMLLVEWILMFLINLLFDRAR